MPLSWTAPTETSFLAEDDKYTYRITQGILSPYQGMIYRKTAFGVGMMVFAYSYLSLGAAKLDLEQRGLAEYFVKPEDVTITPPSGGDVTAPAPPESELAPGYVLDKEDVASVGGVAASAAEIDSIVGDESGPLVSIDSDIVDAPTEDETTIGLHRVELYQDSGSLWRWRRRAANGRIISHSAENYTEKRGCVHGLRLANQDTNHIIVDLTEGDAQ